MPSPLVMSLALLPISYLNRAERLLSVPRQNLSLSISCNSPFLTHPPLLPTLPPSPFSPTQVFTKIHFTRRILSTPLPIKTNTILGSIKIIYKYVHVFAVICSIPSRTLTDVKVYSVFLVSLCMLLILCVSVVLPPIGELAELAWSTPLLSLIYKTEQKLTSLDFMSAVQNIKVNSVADTIIKNAAIHDNPTATYSAFIHENNNKNIFKITRLTIQLKYKFYVWYLWYSTILYSIIYVNFTEYCYVILAFHLNSYISGIKTNLVHCIISGNTVGCARALLRSMTSAFNTRRDV